MLRGMREFLMLVVFLAFCFNVCALNLSPYVYALFSDDDSVSRNHSDDWKNFMMMQSDQQGFARESDRQGFARESDRQGFARESGKQDFARESGKQDFARESGKQDFARESGRQDFARESGRQDFAREKGRQDFAREKGRQDFAREKGRQDFARERTSVRWSPLNLPVSMPAVGSMVLPIDVFKPALGSRLLPDMVKNILRPPPLPTPTTQKMVEVQCRAGRIVVRVLRELFGLPNAQQDLSLGTCQVNKVTPLHFYFDYSLGSCKTMRKSFNDRMEYSNTLSYAPAFSGPVVRALPFRIPLQCIYYRFFNSYKAGYRTCPKGTTEFKSLNMPSGITLTSLNDDWMKNDVYLLGQPMNFEVKVPQKTRNERVYVNKCYVTKSANPTSTPRFAVIDNYGCMLDSVKNPQSKFVPDARQNKIRFKIWAFVFPETRTQVTQKLFMHCETAIGGPVATPSAKACTFDGQRWKELFGADDACSCCSSKCPAGLKTSAMKIISSEPLSITKDGQGSPAAGNFRNVKGQAVSPTQKMFEDIWNFSD
nr:uncharacterized protein LOC111836574 isoform X1 [Paramormyrops kingsleyae]